MNPMNITVQAMIVRTSHFGSFFLGDGASSVFGASVMIWESFLLRPICNLLFATLRLAVGSLLLGSVIALLSLPEKSRGWSSYGEPFDRKIILILSHRQGSSRVYFQGFAAWDLAPGMSQDACQEVLVWGLGWQRVADTQGTSYNQQKTTKNSSGWFLFTLTACNIYGGGDDKLSAPLFCLCPSCETWQRLRNTARLCTLNNRIKRSRIISLNIFFPQPAWHAGCGN